MKPYELTVVVHPDVDADIETTTKNLSALVTDNGGEITKTDLWGKKRLAYPIRKQDFGVYVYFEADLPAEAPAKISNSLNINDQVLRYLLVGVDPKLAKLQAQEAAEK